MLSVLIESAGYSEGREVLRNLNFTAKEGELVLIGGRSGSGKTTSLFAMTGVLSTLLKGYVEGKVTFNDRNILEAEDPVSSAGRLYGFVLQDPDRQLLMPTPYDEVMFTLENFGYEESRATARTEALLERFGLKEKMLEHVENLSGGEKRRLSLASAVAHDPPVLLFDEPTASLDPWGIRELKSFIREQLESGKAVIVVEHKAKYFLDLSSEVLVLRGDGSSERLGGVRFSNSLIEKLEAYGVDSSPAVGMKRAPPASTEKVLEANGLRCWYDEKNPVIESADLEVMKGEAVALVGPNGSGKTTLLKSIAGFHKKCEGELKFYGGKRRPFYVPQVPEYLFIKNTLSEEVKLISKSTGKREEEIAGLLGFYSDMKDLSPYALSLGQRRWLSAVIAWSYDPSVILFDEPTVGLDKFLLRELFRRIASMKERGISFLISTHDPRVLAEIADRAYALKDRKLEEVDPSDKARELEEVAGVAS